MKTLATKTERHWDYVLVLRDLLAREASEQLCRVQVLHPTGEVHPKHIITAEQAVSE
jgi:hypothetical protein